MYYLQDKVFVRSERASCKEILIVTHLHVHILLRLFLLFESIGFSIFHLRPC